MRTLVEGTKKMMMMARRHHSETDVESKLRQADEMAARGSTQKEISKALGISVMTYHRWRRSRVERQSDESIPVASTVAPSMFTQSERLSALELENERLRRLVADLLLEKMALQDQLEGRRPIPRQRTP
jgi:putative transposase